MIGAAARRLIVENEPANRRVLEALLRAEGYVTVSAASGEAALAAVALASIGVAHSLKLEVVAEGVETADQLSYLREHMQGYYFSKPLARPELLLGSRRRLAGTSSGSGQLIATAARG